MTTKNKICKFVFPATAMPLRRREFLVSSAASVVAFGFPAIVNAKPRNFAFQHGVASGDPLPDGAIIWTRVTPVPEATPGSGLGRSAMVQWEVSTDPLFGKRSQRGVVMTSAAKDHTVKVDVKGLHPNSHYYYRFHFKNERSVTGRFRTAPYPGTVVNSVRFAVASCSNFEVGFFSAYRHIANRRDLDFVLHVGDYIYEYEPRPHGPGATIGRMHEPANEILTLEDYRRRHAQYKADPDLQALHAAHAFICTWDDHELANDSWQSGAGNHQPATEGDFFARRARAYQAYFEWMPIRLPAAETQPTRIYRQFQFGNLADLSMLDLRQYRSEQPANGSDPERHDPERVIVGREQLDWLKENVGASAATWKLVGNPVMITPVDFRQPLPPGILEQLGLMMGVPFSVDSWDGYTDDRAELLEHLAGNQINNVAFLTGDIHSSWACNVPRGSGSAPSVAVELVGTSITSDNLNEILGVSPRTLSVQVEQVFQLANPHVRYLEFDSHGYSIVEVTPARMQMDWHYITDRAQPGAPQSFARAFQVPVGTNQVIPAPGPLGPRI